MKNIKHIVFGCLITFSGCIGLDIEEPIPETVRLSNVPNELFAGGTYNLSAIYTDEDGDEVEQTFAWISSNNEIFSVNNEGLLSAHQEGSATLTASVNGVKDEALIVIKPSQETVTITNFPGQLQVDLSFEAMINYQNFEGKVIPASGLTIEWSSSDETVATVSGTGLVRGIKAGNTNITVKVGNATDSKALTVRTEAIETHEKISVTKFDPSLRVGESYDYDATFWDSNNMLDNNKVILWQSSNPLVATVNSDGLVMAISEGTTDITAVSDTVKSDPVKLTVSAAASQTIRTGMLSGPSYGIEGDFSLFRNDNNDLILKIDGYKISSAPGPYFYLSNSSSSVSGGVMIAIAETSKDYEFNLTEIDASIEINTYDWLVVWCDPFRITLGSGQFDN